MGEVSPRNEPASFQNCDGDGERLGFGVRCCLRLQLRYDPGRVTLTDKARIAEYV
jgi:hypothetical protein